MGKLRYDEAHSSREMPLHQHNSVTHLAFCEVMGNSGS